MRKADRVLLRAKEIGLNVSAELYWTLLCQVGTYFTSRKNGRGRTDDGCNSSIHCLIRTAALLFALPASG